MTRAKPICRSCKSYDHVRTLGGGTHNKYRYICDSCDTKWQETPPHKVCGDIDNDFSIMKQNMKRPSNYKCGRCGLPKKGHVCRSTNSSKVAEAAAAEVLASNLYEPASTAFSNQVSTPKGIVGTPFPVQTQSIPLPLPSGESVLVPFSAFQNTA